MIRNPLSRFKTLFKLEKKNISRLYLYAVFSGLLSLSLPLGIQSALYFVQSGQITTSWIMLVLLVIAGVILTGVLQIMQLRISENIQQHIFVHYSFEYAHRFPRFHRLALKDKIPVELMNRFFDIIGLQKGFSKVLLDFPAALLQIFFSLIVLSFYHPFYILFSILLISLLILIFRPLIKKGFETSLKESKYKYATAFWLQEIARANWSFRLIPDEQLSLSRLDKNASDYLKIRESHFTVLWKQYNWMIAIKSLIVAALIGLGGYLVISQQINLGQFVAAEVLILLLLGAVEKIIQSLETFYDVYTSLEKLEQINDIPLAFDDTADTQPVELFPVELINIQTSGAEPILTIAKHEHIQLIGYNQAKINKLLRSLIDFSEDEQLQPRWNYQIPDNIRLENGYRQIGWFSANTQLIEGTLLENIQMGRTDVHIEAIKTALTHCGLDHFFKQIPEGLNLPVSTSNNILSEEEKERVLIARALVHRPQFALLSFIGSSIPAEKLKLLMENLIEHYPETTFLFANETSLLSSIQTIDFNSLS